MSNFIHIASAFSLMNSKPICPKSINLCFLGLGSLRRLDENYIVDIEFAQKCDFQFRLFSHVHEQVYQAIDCGNNKYLFVSQNL